MKLTKHETEQNYGEQNEDPLNEDWYDPTDAGGVRVQFIGEADNLPSSFQKKRSKSWIQDLTDDIKDDIYVVRHGRRRSFFFLGIFAMLAISGAVTASVFLSRSRIKENEEMKIDQKMNSNFDPMTESLVSHCSLQSIRSVSGLKLCESLCSVADCCEIPKGKDLYCYSERKKDCDDYRRVCSAIDLSEEEKMNESDLQLAERVITTCQKDNIGTDQGKQACTQICDEHHCCFDDDEQKNCSQDDSKKCYIYAGCFTLYDPKQYSIFSIVDSKCNRHELSSISGFNECHSTCAAHLCCFSSDPNENCADDLPMECASYSPCAILTNSSIFVDKNIQDESYEESVVVIKRACAKDNLQNYKGLEECHEICSKAMCCFTHKDMVSNCIDSLGDDVCSLYGPCEILANGDEDPNIVVTSPHLEDIDDLCNPDRIKRHGGKQCQTACDKASCCLSSEPGGCLDTDKNWCLSYKECKNINTKWKEFDGEKDHKKGATTEENIEAICSLANFSKKLGRDVGLDICHSICDPHACCFAKGKDSCDDDNNVFCKEFKACKDLYLYEEKKELVNTACGKDSTIKECKDLCEGWNCCFDYILDSLNCDINACGIYDSCEPFH